MSIQDNDIYLSSAVPECAFESDSYAFSEVRFILRYGIRSFFETSIFFNPNTALAIFRPGKIIHAFMADLQISFAVFSIAAYDPDSNKLMDLSFRVVASATKIRQDPALFLARNFLNDFNVMTVPRSYSGAVSLYDPEPGKISFHGVGNSDLTPIQVFEYSHQGGYVSFRFSIQELIDIAIQSGQVPDGFSPRLFIVKSGERSLHLYITERRPAFLVEFRNSFSSPEYLYSFGSFRFTGKQSADTADSGEQKLAYSVIQKPEFELTTEPLEPTQILRFNSMVNSSGVRVALFSGNQVMMLEGIITALDTDFDSRSDEMGSAKLTFFSSQDLGILNFNDTEMMRIFTNPFNDSFS